MTFRLRCENVIATVKNGFDVDKVLTSLWQINDFESFIKIINKTLEPCASAIAGEYRRTELYRSWEKFQIIQNNW